MFDMIQPTEQEQAMALSNKILDPKNVTATFGQNSGQLTLTMGHTSTIPVMVSNNSKYTLANTNVQQTDIKVYYTDPTTKKVSDVTSYFTIGIPGGASAINFSSPMAPGKSDTQQFYVTPATNATSYLGTSVISFGVDKIDDTYVKINYDVADDTGGQSTSKSWTFSTGG